MLYGKFFTFLHLQQQWQAVKKMEAVYTESNRHITMNFLQNLKISHQKSGLYSFSQSYKIFFRYHPNSVSCNIQTF